MDLLTHIFLPPMLFASQVSIEQEALLLAPLAILPDLDVFLGIHRNLLIIIPFIALLFILARKYHRYAAFSLSPHLFPDFLAGSMLFLYPLVETGVRIEFPFVPKFSSPPVLHQSYQVFPSFGIASMLIFLAIHFSKPGWSH